MNVLHLTGGFDRIWALMKRQPVWFVKMVFLTGLILSAPRMDAGAGIELVDGDRVAFLGGTLFDRGRLYGEIETALLSHFRGRNLTVRNLGWDGDTVFGHARAGGRRGAIFGDSAEGFENLREHVKRVNPTIVFLAYGGAEAHSGSEGLVDFEAGLNRLLDALAAPHRRFVLLTPLRVLGEGIPLRARTAARVDQLNLNLKAYRDGIARVASRRGLKVVDLFSAAPLLRAKTRIRGLHLSAAGYGVLGKYLVRDECVRPPQVEGLTAGQLEILRQRVIRKNELFHNWWRPRNDAFVFGERKSEQVPVQLELPQFEGLIAGFEASIRELTQ